MKWLKEISNESSEEELPKACGKYPVKELPKIDRSSKGSWSNPAGNSPDRLLLAT